MVLNKKKIFILLIGVFGFNCLSILALAQIDQENSGSKLIGNNGFSQDNVSDQTNRLKNNSRYVSGLESYHMPDKERMDEILTNISSRAMIRVIHQKRKLFWLGRQSEEVRQSDVHDRDNAQDAILKPEVKNVSSDGVESDLPVQPNTDSGTYRETSVGYKLPVSHSRLISDDFTGEERMTTEEEYQTQKQSERAVLIGAEDSSGLLNEQGLLQVNMTIEGSAASGEGQSVDKEERNEK